MLSDLDLGTGYSTGRADLVRSFYVPCLDQARRYDRAVGYFRSSLFILVGLAFSTFARRGGRMRLVCSPNLDRQDAEAVGRGIALKDRIDTRLLEDLESLLEDPENHPVAEFLATLVATSVLDIRLAFRAGGNGIFHDKVGLFEDPASNRVSFVGSANETFSAWDQDANHEGFEVFCSWRGQADDERVTRHSEYLSNLWAGHEPGLTVLEFSAAVKARLLDLSNPEGIDVAAEKLRRVVLPRTMQATTLPVVARTRTLQSHQRLAVENWFAAGHRGIITHATGSGKTLTALEIIRRWIKPGNPAIVFVPTQVLAYQWRAELQRELGDAMVGLLDAGAGFGRRTWENDLADYTRNMPALGPRVVLATMQTGSSPEFLKRVKGGEHLLIVADEVHRLGSAQGRSILGISAGGRLGLSATPERFGDPEGTNALRAYFGESLAPPFTIGDAIRAGRLVPYDYFVHRVFLTAQEQDDWDQATHLIRQAYARLPRAGSGSPVHTEAYKLLLIRRARIAKQASQKVPLATEILAREHTQGDRWLVYCDDMDQLQAMSAASATLGLLTYEYHSAMEGSPRETLESFQLRGGILVAIKCLDEGIDLPALNRALILASSKNPREFIQRRGRVLRSIPDKYSAQIHDLIVVPRQDTGHDSASTKSLTRGELARAHEFANYSRNAATKMDLELIAAASGLNATADEDGSFEEED